MATVVDIAVVVPVYRGESTLRPLVEHLAQYHAGTTSPGGNDFRITEVLLVHDWGPDRSDEVMRSLAEQYPFVQCVWLMRNSGQHAATAAGIASSGAAWVCTMDEDGQHDPDAIGALVDVALTERAHLVYGVNAGRPSHPRWRIAASSTAKAVARGLFGSPLGAFSSFRLVDGPRARAACAYVGQRTFLDVALSWTVQHVAHHPVVPRAEGRPGSGYRLRSLLSHFWTLVLSSGTRPLRVVSFVGLLSAVAGLVGAAVVVFLRLSGRIETAGWASVFVAVLVMGGAILFALGVLAEFVGATLRTVQGRPTFVIGTDPGPRPPAADER